MQQNIAAQDGFDFAGSVIVHKKAMGKIPGILQIQQTARESATTAEIFIGNDMRQSRLFRRNVLRVIDDYQGDFLRPLRIAENMAANSCNGGQDIVFAVEVGDDHAQLDRISRRGIRPIGTAIKKGVFFQGCDGEIEHAVLPGEGAIQRERNTGFGQRDLLR